MLTLPDPHRALSQLLPNHWCHQPRLNSPGPRRSSSLLDMDSPRTTASFHPGPCSSLPRPNFKGCPQTCIRISDALPVPGFLLGIGGPCADIWRGATGGVSSLRTGRLPAPLTCPEKGKPQGPHRHPSPESQGSGPGCQHPGHPLPEAGRVGMGTGLVAAWKEL